MDSRERDRPIPAARCLVLAPTLLLHSTYTRDAYCRTRARVLGTFKTSTGILRFNVLTQPQEMFIKQECYNPSMIEPKALNHWIECVKQPGGNRGILETYRSAFKSAELHRKLLKEGGKLTLPIMTVGVRI